MSETLQEMIGRLCPNGVAYRKIGDVAKCYSGATPSKAIKEYWQDGTISWMNSGEVNLGRVYQTENRITQLGFDSCSTKMVPPHTVVIALAGQGKTRGTVAMTEIELCTNQSLCAIVVNECIDSYFLFHYLKGQYHTLRQISSGDGTRGGLNQDMIRNFEIPVPPLEVQRKIVEVLDNFSALTAALTAELTVRQKQYEYYRDNLLSFSNINRGGQSEVKWKTLGEVCKLYTGGEVPDGTIKGQVNPTDACPYPVYANGKETYGFTNSYQIPDNAVCISSIGANTGAVFYRIGNFTPAIRLKVLVPLDSEELDTKFLYYIATTIDFSVKNTGSVPNINADFVKARTIPIPSLKEQKRIVAILDHFETLTTDLTNGLPAEIKARKQQYEYYRDKLLTFRRKTCCFF